MCKNPVFRKNPFFRSKKEAANLRFGLMCNFVGIRLNGKMSPVLFKCFAVKIEKERGERRDRRVRRKRGERG